MRSGYRSVGEKMLLFRGIFFYFPIEGLKTEKGAIIILTLLLTFNFAKDKIQLQS